MSTSESSKNFADSPEIEKTSFSFPGIIIIQLDLKSWSCLLIDSVIACADPTKPTIAAIPIITPKVVKKVLISWPESARFFPKEKVVLTGLPLRKEIVSLAKERKKISTADHQINTIYITGGKQGSQAINRAVEGCLEKLLSDFEVIHQCGSLDFEKFLKTEDNLPEKLKARYIVKDYFPQNEIAQVYRIADFVVGRAGAHTVYELAALGKPAILIPILWSSHNEQQENAEILERVGLAEIIPQKELNPRTLLEACHRVGKHLRELEEPAEKARRLVCLDAAEKIAVLEHFHRGDVLGHEARQRQVGQKDAEADGEEFVRLQVSLDGQEYQTQADCKHDEIAHRQIGGARHVHKFVQQSEELLQSLFPLNGYSMVTRIVSLSTTSPSET